MPCSQSPIRVQHSLFSSPGSEAGWGAQSHPAPSCSTPTSCGKWVGRSETSILRQSPVRGDFFLLDNFLFHIPLVCPFLFFWVFLTFRFNDSFFMASPLSQFFSYDSPVRVRHSCRQRTCWGEWVPDRCRCHPVGPLLRVGPCFAPLLLEFIPDAPCLEEPKSVYLTWS